MQTRAESCSRCCTCSSSFLSPVSSLISLLFLSHECRGESEGSHVSLSADADEAAVVVAAAVISYHLSSFSSLDILLRGACHHQSSSCCMPLCCAPRCTASLSLAAASVMCLTLTGAARECGREEETNVPTKTHSSEHCCCGSSNSIAMKAHKPKVQVHYLLRARIHECECVSVTPRSLPSSPSLSLSPTPLSQCTTSMRSYTKQQRAACISACSLTSGEHEGEKGKRFALTITERERERERESEGKGTEKEEKIMHVISKIPRNCSLALALTSYIRDGERGWNPRCKR